MTDQEIKVVDMMARYGGSFVKALAECFYRADHVNFGVLKSSFPAYWKQYEKMLDK